MWRNSTLGLLGLLGGACYMLGGLRMLFLAYGEDRVTDTLGIAWAIGWVFAGLALLRMRVTGATRFGRTVSIVLIAGFACASLWGVHRLIDPVTADHGPFAIAPMIVILGMFGTGILAIRGNVLRGWQRSLPLLIAVVYVVTIVISSTTGESTLKYAFSLGGLGYLLLGNAIRTQASK